MALTRTGLCQFALLTHRFAAPERDCGVVDTHRDRIAAERAFMQNFDVGAFDEPEFEQTPLELRCLGVRRSGGRGNGIDAAAESLARQTQGRRPGRGL